jgi:hypothetical protein
MKNIVYILLSVFIVSCSKKDTINHYLNKPVTEAELIENGFYKYTYSYTYDYENDGSYTDSINNIKFGDSLRLLNGKVYKYELYSNVKPQKGENGKLYPVPLLKYNQHLDNALGKQRISYIEDELENRVVSYFFVNNTLKYKNVFFYAVDKNKKYIADFRTTETIIKYYDSLKIPFKPIIDGKRSTKKHTTLFMINNYKTQIYNSIKKNEIAYEMITNYVDDEMPYWDIMNDWYGGDTYELSE